MFMPVATIVGSALAVLGLLLVWIGSFSFRADRLDRNRMRVSSPLAITGIISGVLGVGIIVAAYIATYGV
ncbi:MAG: hypothetical protein L0H81_08200 [Actinomyces sp.]|nr:hypothetical protein [Actinomyces sp.]MDN6566173.1 hypothetical protein [Actinomyces sp.]MDN6794253.1 hypothetical protein [Propionibacterium sp.]